MKKSLLLILLLSVLALAVFARHKEKQNKYEPISVSIHRSACFGRCPDYEVKADKNGWVTYTGNMFVKDSGTFVKNRGAAATQKILAMCALYRVDTCKDVYNNMVPDLPGLYFTIVYKGSIKKIINASFGPGFLREIANSIDAIAKPDNTWEKVPAPVKGK